MENSSTPFQKDEKSVELLSELIDLFSPQNGRVLDPYGAAMATAIAALKTNRQFICLERNASCF